MLKYRYWYLKVYIRCKVIVHVLYTTLQTTLPVLVYICTSVQSTPIYCCVMLTVHMQWVIVVWGDLLRVGTQCRHHQDDMLHNPCDIIFNINNTLPPPFPPMLDTTQLQCRIVLLLYLMIDFMVHSRLVTMGSNGRNYINARLREGMRYGVFNFIQLESDVAVSWALFMFLK